MKKFKPGVSFSDFVISDSSSKKSRIGQETESRDFRRGWMVIMGVVIGFGVLWVRALVLQGFYGERYRVLSDQNRVQRITLPAPRGQIVDRNGQVLAGNQEEKNNEHVVEVTTYDRKYPFSLSTAHAIGYLGQVNEEEVGIIKSQEKKFENRDMVGRSGLEQEYETVLRGVDGGKLVEVDNMGKLVRDLGNKNPVPGVDLKVSLDGSLSQVALEAMGGKKGAVVVSDPRTGEILVITSSPSFDPNLFGREGQTEKVAQILLDEATPMFNRAISGVYPPGSTFKMVTTAAAIDSGKVRSDYIFEDHGVIKVGDFSYTNWLFTKRGRTEGLVGFEKGLAHSVDTFFYRVGELTGPVVMADWSHKFGLGQETAVDLPGESTGLIATPDWKEKVKGEKWFLGNTYHMAIGQGDILTTPLQVNLMTNVLATAGKKCKPHLVKKPNMDECPKVEISEVTMELIRKGMLGACSTGGTAFPLFGFEPRVACKTGTAEYFDGRAGKMKTHGWLTAYAPADNPEVSVTVLMEGGGEGSNVAAPVVRKILSRYFNVTDTYNYAAIPQEIGE